MKPGSFSLILGVILTALSFVVTGCGGGSAQKSASTPDDSVAQVKAASAFNAQFDTSAYAIEIEDSDRWVLAFNPTRTRYDYIFYHGKMYYSSGSKIYEGNAAAVYSTETGDFSMMAEDNGYAKDYLMYDMSWRSGDSNTLVGSYVYLIHHNGNQITATLNRGTLGSHTGTN